MRQEDSRLGRIASEFDEVTERLERTYCKEGCHKEESCEKAGICRTAVEQANLVSLRYKGVLEQVEELTGAIPKEYAERFIHDISRCIKIIYSLNKGGNFVDGFVQQMIVRMDIVGKRMTQY